MFAVNAKLDSSASRSPCSQERDLGDSIPHRSSEEA